MHGGRTILAPGRSWKGKQLSTGLLTEILACVINNQRKQLKMAGDNNKHVIQVLLLSLRALIITFQQWMAVLYKWGHQTKLLAFLPWLFTKRPAALFWLDYPQFLKGVFLATWCYYLPTSQLRIFKYQEDPSTRHKYKAKHVN